MNKDGKWVIFWATDSPCVNTGFGRVSYEVITRLLKTGKYEIHVMGTNDRGEPHPLRGIKGLFIYPLANIEQDPYGFQEMPHLLNKIQPDLIFALNDVWVWTGDERQTQLQNWFLKHVKNYGNAPWIGYFPVDGRPWEKRWADLVNGMAYGVTFSDYGYRVLQETEWIDKDKVKLIYHGASVDKFFPLDQETIKQVRKEKLGIEDNRFLIGTVSRNQPRKNVPRLIQAFKCFSDGYGACKECGHYQGKDIYKDCECCGSTDWEFHEGVGSDNTALYLHMNLLDMKGNRLTKILDDNKVRNIIVRPSHHVALGVSIEELNHLYNAMDLFVMCTYAGGYELPFVEAQAAGTPALGTRTTCVTEHLNEGKGFLVNPSTHVILDDANHCHKHLIDFNKLVDTFFEMYNDRDKLNSVIPKALEYAHSRDWEKPAKQFDALFEKTLKERELVVQSFKSPETRRKILLINKTTNPGELLTMIPLLKALKAQHENPEIVLAAKKNVVRIIENSKNIDKVIDADKMIVSGQLNNASMQDVSDVIQNYDNTIAKFAGMPWEEAYVRAFNMETDDYNLEIFFDKEDKKFAKKSVPDSDTMTVGICVDANVAIASLDMVKWKGIIDFIAKLKINVVVFNYDNYTGMENVSVVKGNDMRRAAACMDRCDVIVTMDNMFSIVGKTLKKRMVIISGPRDVAYKMKNYDNYIVVNKHDRFDCMPCWVGTNGKCLVSGNEMAACLSQINPSDIFKEIIKIKKEMESEKVAEHV